MFRDLDPQWSKPGEGAAFLPRTSIPLSHLVQDVEDRLAEAKDLIGYMLATLTLPSNQDRIRAGDAKAITELYRLVESWQQRAMKLK